MSIMSEIAGLSREQIEGVFWSNATSAPGLEG